MRVFLLFSRFGRFLFFINICSVSMEARLDVVGLWVEEGFSLGRGGDVSRALNQTKETRIDRCGFTGLTPISLSADY